MGAGPVSREATVLRRRLRQNSITGGAEGDRTPDLVIANDALSQLSYGPDPGIVPNSENHRKRRP